MTTRLLYYAPLSIYLRLSLSAFLFLGLCFGLMAQTPEALQQLSYEQLEKQTDTLSVQGLTQSAYNVAVFHRQKAQKEGNEVQYLKALNKELELLLFLSKSDWKNVLVNRLQQEIQQAKPPLKNMLAYLLAKTYEYIYRTYAHQFKSKTLVANYKPEDIETWSIENLIQALFQAHEASLANSELLQKTPLQTYQALLQPKDKQIFELRPSLYDFLAHEALGFYMQYDQLLFTQPAYQFVMKDSSYFSPSAEFINLRISTPDTYSVQAKALQLLQALERLHQANPSTDIRLHLILKRLKIVHGRHILPQKDRLYVQALEKLVQQYQNSPAVVEVIYELAYFYKERGEKLDVQGRPLYQQDLAKAYQLCQQAIDKYPNAWATANCQRLMQEIRQKNLYIQTEAVISPKQHTSALVSYKNMQRIYAKIVPISLQTLATIEAKARELHPYDSEKVLAYKLQEYLKIKPLHSWQHTLWDEKDFQYYSIEVPIPPLESGSYVIMFSEKENFDTENNILSSTFIQVSPIAHFSKNLSSAMEVYTRHRHTGEALKGTQLQVFEKDRANPNQKVVKNAKTNEVLRADEEGRILVPTKKIENYEFFIDFQHQKSALHAIGNISNFFKSYYSDEAEPEKLTEKVLFFTDRAIYRPNQTIYFKGIVTQGKQNEWKVMPNLKTKVALYDANYQKVQELDVVTNNFGSFSGTFVAPAILLGNLTIECMEYRETILVEEYKRPSFEITMLPDASSEVLGKEVEVRGKAQMYAGAAIDQAKVVYRVERTTLRQRPFYFFEEAGYRENATTLITQGETMTNSNGEFIIPFIAQPDEQVAPDKNPIFVFQINIDITDRNGETRSTQKTLRMGYKTLSIEAEVPQFVEQSQTKEAKWQIKAISLAGEAQTAQLKVTIFQLQMPATPFQKRPFEKPKQQLLSEAEFRQKFPFYALGQEDNPNEWKRLQVMTEQTLSSPQNATLQLNNLQTWQQGLYLCLIETQDTQGQKVSEKVFFEVVNKQSTLSKSTKIWQVYPIKTTAEPQQNAEILLSSPVEMYVLLEVEKNKKIVQKEWIKLNNSQKLVQIPVQESDRGGFLIRLSSIWHNQFYSEAINIKVPFSNKELNVQFQTFRDKLQPNQQEEWQLKITGKNNEKVAAELVATLYDASLDALRKHSFGATLYYPYLTYQIWESRSFALAYFNSYQNNWNPNLVTFKQRLYPAFERVGIYKRLSATYFYSIDGNEESSYNKSLAMPTATANMAFPKNNTKTDERDTPIAGSRPEAEYPLLALPQAEVAIRKNLQETAFFYPHLQTNAQGEVIIKFTMPEALTRWQMYGFAHTTDMRLGAVQQQLVTQKKVMVVPNMPRFLREGDQITLQAKITNMSDSLQKGIAQINFMNPITNKPLSLTIAGQAVEQAFELAAKQSTVVSWTISLPQGLQALTINTIAQAQGHSDGESHTLPVLANRLLLTESLPISIGTQQTKNFSFTKLLQSNKSNTLRHEKLSVEFTPNPIWYAVQALPYLMEFPYECAEQTFSRLYANAIAGYISQANPRFQQVFEVWKQQSPEAFAAQLEKNQELKNVILAETPWVLQAQDEKQRKRNIALLFDLNRMKQSFETSLQKLQKQQLSSGAWGWFEGMPADRFITQHIATGLGHLHKITNQVIEDSPIYELAYKSVRWLDAQIAQDFAQIKARIAEGKATWEDNHTGYWQIQYLYMRSLLPQMPTKAPYSDEAVTFYQAQIKKFWYKWVENKYMLGMIALVLHRQKDQEVPAKILKVLQEQALVAEEMGMYWKNTAGYHWYELPIETHALLVEVFSEISPNDQKSIDLLRTWLLKQKQTQDWKTTKATVAACHALLLQGTNWAEQQNTIEIDLGNIKVNPQSEADSSPQEAGTGYFKKSWQPTAIKPEMGNIVVKNTNTAGKGSVAWGAIHWQYWENLDKITATNNNLKISKQILKESYISTGKVLLPLKEGEKLKISDKVVVRIMIQTDRKLEYLHLKDMRAAGLEPINVLSGYKSQGMLGYYESTRDAATHFFFGSIPEGTHILEYPLRVAQAGNFANGISTLQSMYAPEFNAHTEGVRIQVER